MVRDTALLSFFAWSILMIQYGYVSMNETSFFLLLVYIMFFVVFVFQHVSESSLCLSCHLLQSLFLIEAVFLLRCVFADGSNSRFDY